MVLGGRFRFQALENVSGVRKERTEKVCSAGTGKYTGADTGCILDFSRIDTKYIEEHLVYELCEDETEVK